MRATAKLFAASISIVIMLPGSAWAGASPIAGQMLLTAAAIGQTDNAQRRESDQLLRHARQAMAAGDLDTAESYLERAEQLNVQYETLFARFTDTPAKVREELERQRGKAGRETAPEDTYGAAPANLRVNRFPPVGQNQEMTPAGNPGGAFPSTMESSHPESGAAGSSEAGHWLREARRALAAGNHGAAAEAIAKAEAVPGTYPLHADSPAKVKNLLQQAQSFDQRSGTASQDPDLARQHAQFLMDQAEGLLNYQDYEQARQLVQRAQRIPAQYQPFDRTPQQLLERIAAQQRRALPGAPESQLDPTAGRPMAPSAPSDHPLKSEVLRLLATAQAAMDRGELQTARELVEEAQKLPVPDSVYAADEMRPWKLMLQINAALNRRGGAVTTAGATEPLSQAPGDFPVQRGLYDPANDPSRVVAAQETQPGTPAPPASLPGLAAGPKPIAEGERLYELGLRALEARDRTSALRYFDQAWQHEQQLDPLVRQQLQDKLTLLRQAAATEAANAEPSRLEAVDTKQQLLRQKLYREITSEQAEAEKMAAKDAKGALERLRKLRDRVREAEVEPTAQKQLLTIVDRSIERLQRYIEDHRADIELNEQNAAVLEEIDRGRLQTIEVQNEIARLVEQFEQLLDERRYAEAEIIAKKAHELDPESPVVQNLVWKSHFVRRFQEQIAIGDLKEDSFNGAMGSVDASSEPFDDRNPLVFDVKRWKELTPHRKRLLERQNKRLSGPELKIQESLKTQVEVRFEKRPLSEVMQTLGALAGVNVYLDPQGLAAEGITSDTIIDFQLPQPVSLRSALSLILEPLHLSYVIQHEVLRITSEQIRDSDVYPVTYNVADLVIPIPNFVPSYNIGLPGAIREAHNAIGYGGPISPGGTVPFTVAANDAMGTASSEASVLAQMAAGGALGGLTARPPQPLGFGPGGMGGGAQADFDSLVELITTTIEPQTWNEVGGPGSIQEFEGNLSLVISQTQEVHEEIADLLDQLRRLQDLQVTIEVRFITLNDTFFERIGIDFDFDIDDNVGIAQENIALLDDRGPSVTVGLSPDGLPTADLDLSFSQDSFNATVPAIAGFDPQTAANFGFAILSDIEVFFLLQAAQGDTRSNVLQAPKVTLFSGQLASVSDLSQRPFVTSVIPVVGDFAAAHQPVIVVLSEGTSLSVQAVVSPDRRFVRLTLVPFFSSIGDVETFTFTGKTTSDSGTNVIDPDGDPQAVNNQVRTTEGTTVQLPTFSFTSVTTTVSVPDGGTILLGGIKRLNENRNERGVPMLSKIPYISRLFRNVGIGRTTQSLMMMVTPRIIIQEEEEEKLFGFEPAPY